MGSFWARRTPSHVSSVSRLASRRPSRSSKKFTASGRLTRSAAFFTQPLSPQKHPIGRILGLVDAVIPELPQEIGEFALVGRRHLHADQHPTIVGPVIAVVKQADVP